MAPSRLVNIFREVTRRLLGEGFLAGVSRAGFVRIIGLLANFSFFALAGKFFGPAVLGRFSIAMIVFMIASILCIHGLSAALVRFTGQDMARGDVATARHRLQWSTRRVAVIAAVVSMSIVGLSFWIARSAFFDVQLAISIGILGAALVPFTLIQLAAASAQGLGRVGLHMSLSFLLIPTMSTLILLVLYRAWGDEQVLASSYALGILAVSAVAFVGPLFRGSSETTFLSSANREEMTRVAYPLLWSSLAGVMLGWADTLMLGVFVDADEVGLYAIAFRLTLFAGLARQIVSVVGAGRMAKAFEANDKQVQQQVLSYTGHLGILFGAPFVLFLLIFAEPALAIIGPEFRAASHLVQILLVGEFLGLSLGTPGVAMQMTGLERQLRRIVIGALVFNIFFNLLLIPFYGATGAALVTAVTSVLQRTVMAFCLFKAHGTISPIYFSWVRLRGN
jgi:O-antigen/teichoic acid export membrane protein